MGRSENFPPAVESAFAHCLRIAREHYENFPVASLLVPRDRRPYVAAVYAFARGADDLADEGALAPAERLRLLDDWEARLDEAIAGRAAGPVFVAVAATAARTGAPRELFAALLRAFRTDVTTARYRSFSDLLGYCRNSANPVGRLVLHIFGQANERTLPRSDDVCTALQLTNFWQDLAADLSRGRIYLPLEDLDRFGYTEEELAHCVVDRRFRALMAFQVDRTEALFAEGAPLLDEVEGRLRWELDVTVRGGMAILARIRRAGYDTLTRRPALTAAGRAALVAGLLIRRPSWMHRRRP